LGDVRIRAAFLRHHADLLTPEFWQKRQQRIRAGIMEDVFPYPQQRRFGVRAQAWTQRRDSTAAPASQ